MSAARAEAWTLEGAGRMLPRNAEGASGVEAKGRPGEWVDGFERLGRVLKVKVSGD